MSDGKPISAENIGKVLITGDLSVLTEEQRLAYYHRVCESLSLNPLTQPFQYVRLSGGLKLYATRAASEQLAASRGVSIDFVSEDLRNGVYIYRVVARTADGRSAPGTGAVPVEGLKGEALCNAIMKAETKSCRRATLRVCGLGVLDETEVSDIPGAEHPQPLTPPPTGALPPPGRSSPPTTGAELAARLDAFDARGAAAGRWAKGECVAEVLAAGMAEGQPEDIARWDATWLQTAMEYAQHWARQRKRMQPEPEPSAR